MYKYMNIDSMCRLGYKQKRESLWKVIYTKLSILPEGYENTTDYLHPSWDSRIVKPGLYVLGRSMQLWRTDESSFGMLGRRERTWFGLGWSEIGGAWRIRYLLLSWAVDVFSGRMKIQHGFWDARKR